LPPDEVAEGYPANRYFELMKPMSDLREILLIEPTRFRPLPDDEQEANPGTGNRADASPRSAVAQPCEPQVDSDGPFCFRISPNVSLGRSGTLVIFTLLAVPTTGVSIVFALKGYWPVAVFSSLTYLGFVAAMICSRIALKRYEQVYLSQNMLVIERNTGMGRRACSKLPVFGLRLESTIDPDYGHLGLTLRHRARCVELARDLSPAERSNFQAEFLTAMEKAGHPVRLTTVHMLALGAQE